MNAKQPDKYVMHMECEIKKFVVLFIPLSLAVAAIEVVSDVFIAVRFDCWMKIEISILCCHGI